MALITGLPDFFDAATPTATDFNLASESILEQLGGQYFDVSADAIVQKPGNLNTNNLSSSAAFLNSQKAEPYSIYTITATSLTVEPNIGAAFFAPFAFDSTILALTHAQDAMGVSSGSLKIYINGHIVYNFPWQAFTTAADKPAYLKLDIQVRAGDTVGVDSTGVTYTGSPAGDQSSLFTLWCKARHIKK